MSFFEDAWKFVTDAASSVVGADNNSDSDSENNQQGDEDATGSDNTDGGILSLMMDVMRDSIADANEDKKYFFDGVSGASENAAEASGDAGEAVQSAGDAVSEIPFVGPAMGAVLDTAGTVLTYPDKVINGSDDGNTEDGAGETEKEKDKDEPISEVVSKMPELDKSDEQASNDDEVEIVKPNLLDDPSYVSPSALGDELSVSDADFASFLSTGAFSSDSQQPGAGDPLATSTVSEMPSMLSMNGDSSPLMVESEAPDATMSFEMSYFG